MTTPNKKLKVAGHELDFASISFQEIGERVARSQECEARGYHIRVWPSQVKRVEVGDGVEQWLDLCTDCGVWTLNDRFQKMPETS